MAKKKGGKPQGRGVNGASKKPIGPEFAATPSTAKSSAPLASEAAGEESAARTSEGSTPSSAPPAAAKPAASRIASADAPKPETKSAPPKGLAWALPLVKLERGLTWFEVRLLIGVIIALITSLVAWISVRAMSSPVESEDRSGFVFRLFFGATALGFVAFFASTRLKLSERASALSVTAAIAVGGALAPSWRSTGIEFFGHLQNWLQEGSSLTMFGGLRGVSTRLTILLAFVGGSLAAASGKHINIDLALRFVSPKLKLPVFVLQTLASAAFCVVAAWSFFQYIAITNFNVDRDVRGGEMVSKVSDMMGQDLFLLRRQLGFDVDALPHVLEGGKWDDDSRLTGRQWNEILEQRGYRDYFTKEQVDALKAPDSALDGSRLALAIGPDGQPRGQLVRSMNLTFVVGFLFMALRFLLRLGLVVTGHVDMEGEHDTDPDDDPVRHHEREEIAEVAESLAGGDAHPGAAGEGAPDGSASDDATGDAEDEDGSTKKGGA